MLLAAIASDPGTPAILLATLARSASDPALIAALLRNPGTPEDSRQQLARVSLDALGIYLERPCDEGVVFDLMGAGTRGRDRLWVKALGACPTRAVLDAALAEHPNSARLRWALMRWVPLADVDVLAVAEQQAALMRRRQMRLLDTHRAALVHLVAQHPAVRAAIVAAFDDEELTRLAGPYLNPDPVLVAAAGPLNGTVEATRQWVAAAERTIEQVLEALRSARSGAPWRLLIATTQPGADTIAAAALRERPADRNLLCHIAAATFLPLEVRLRAGAALFVSEHAERHSAEEDTVRDLVPVAPLGWVADVLRARLELNDRTPQGPWWWWFTVECARLRPDLPDDLIARIGEGMHKVRLPAQWAYEDACLWLTACGPTSSRVRARDAIEESLGEAVAWQTSASLALAEAGVRAASVGALQAASELPVPTLARVNSVGRATSALLTQALAQVVPTLTEQLTAEVLVALTDSWELTLGELLTAVRDTLR